MIAQTVSFSVKNVSIKELLSKIEKESDVRFSYIDNTLDEKKDVTISVKDESVEKVLSQVLGKKGLMYTRTGNTIAIKKLQATSSQQQKQQKVTGVVSDETGNSMPGVTVMILGTTTGSATSIDGEYSINVAQGETLSFSFIGYKTQFIKVDTKTVLDVKLDVENFVGEEVVVIGYGTQKKVNLSGAVTSVSTATLEDRPVMSIGQALQGAVANLNITIPSGKADESPSFNIRGATSLNSDGNATNGSPLVVIDGIISDADQLNRLNPNDIASMSVLKDASSAAIYGSRAAFGVILVTTRVGRSEKLSFNYNNNFSIRTLTNTPEFIKDPYTVLTVTDIMKAGWYSPHSQEQLAYAKKVSEDPSTSPYFLNPDGTYTYFGNTDWRKEALKDVGFSTQHNFDVSGRTDRVNYYFSAGYNFQDGMVKYGTDTYNRYNLRSKLNFKLTDWWSFGNNTSFITSDYTTPEALDGSYFTRIINAPPLYIPKNPDGTWTDYGVWALGLQSEGGIYVKKETNVNTQFHTKMDIVKDVLSLQGNFAYSENTSGATGSYLPVGWTDGPDKPLNYYNPVTSAYNWTQINKHVLFDVYVSFNKTFNEKHAISSVVGFNQEEYRSDYQKQNRKELISSSLPTPGLAVGEQSFEHTIDTWALRGAFGRLNYTFDDKYIVEFNGRYDGTSRFPKDSRFVFNPSGSLAWVVSKENFFEPLTNVVNFFKIRGSYGSLGNQSVGSYDYLTTMGHGISDQILSGVKPVYVSAPGLVSPNLTWETVTSTNIGVDMTFLDNRLSFTGDAYVRRTTDMLTAGVTLPGVLGSDEPKENVADLETKGWEISLGWRDVVQVAGKDFSYNVNFNLADSRSYITKFENEVGYLGDYYDGYEIGTIWGLETLGFFSSQEEIDAHADQTPVASYPGTRPIAPGDLKFKDIDEDGVIDSGEWSLEDHGDYKRIGNTTARYTFGLSAGASWNGFDLSIFLQGVGKKDYYPGSSDYLFWGVYSSPFTNITVGNHTDRWTEETPNGYFPRYKSYVANGDAEAGIKQTKYLQNAAYIRLKNVNLGYTIPSRITKKVNIEKLRIFFSGDNLGEISGLYKHYDADPDVLGGGAYPLQRSYSLGLNLTF